MNITKIRLQKSYALEHGIQKLDNRVICGTCGHIFGRKVWNSTDERHRRIIWRCNGKYPAKGEKGCESKHIDDVVLYQAFVHVFNAMVENKKYFMGKWQEQLRSDNVLVRYKAKQFMKILVEVDVINTFDADLYFVLVEKIMVYDGSLVVKSVHSFEMGGPDLFYQHYLLKNRLVKKFLSVFSLALFHNFIN